MPLLPLYAIFPSDMVTFPDPVIGIIPNVEIPVLCLYLYPKRIQPGPVWQESHRHCTQDNRYLLLLSIIPVVGSIFRTRQSLPPVLYKFLPEASSSMPSTSWNLASIANPPSPGMPYSCATDGGYYACNFSIFLIRQLLLSDRCSQGIIANPPSSY